MTTECSSRAEATFYEMPVVCHGQSGRHAHMVNGEYKCCMLISAGKVSVVKFHQRRRKPIAGIKRRYQMCSLKKLGFG